MSGQPSATINIYDDDSAILQFTYRVGMVSDLKACIHISDRDYDPSTKEWTVYGTEAIDIALRLLKRNFTRVKVKDWRRTARQDRRLATLDQDFAQLHLLPTAEPKIVRLVYRELAKEVHPDRGGTHEAMLALNASYERLQQAGAA